MIKVKLFSTSQKNAEYAEFLKAMPEVAQKENDEALQQYMDYWFSHNQDKYVIKISNPTLKDGYLCSFVWYNPSFAEGASLDPTVKPKSSQNSN